VWKKIHAIITLTRLILREIGCGMLFVLVKKSAVMKFIPRKIHIVLDLLLIAFLVLSPWLFGFSPRSIPAMVLYLTGAIVLCYALLTKYELGVFRFMNFKNHLMIEFIVGLILACSPWLMEFGGYVTTPHFAAGIFMMLLSVFSKNKSIEISEQEKTITF